MKKINNILIRANELILDILPKQLPIDEIGDYVLSRTFIHKYSNFAQRREILQGIAATAGLMLLPRGVARASGRADAILAIIKGSIECGVSGVGLLKDAYDLFEPTRGKAAIDNADDTHSAKGNIVLAVINEKREVESSAGLHYQVPAATTNYMHFNAGPAPTEEGSKELWVLTDADGDCADFEAEEAN